MRQLIIWVISLYSFSSYAQDANPKIIHINTHGTFVSDTTNSEVSENKNKTNMTISEGVLSAEEHINLKLDSTALIVLSLVESDTSKTRNWNNYIKYKDKTYLIVITTGGENCK
ncbi:MAG: CHAT domain-containing protein [Cytophagaceae bacterium]